MFENVELAYPFSLYFNNICPRWNTVLYFFFSFRDFSPLSSGTESWISLIKLLEFHTFSSSPLSLTVDLCLTCLNPWGIIYHLKFNSPVRLCLCDEHLQQIFLKDGSSFNLQISFSFFLFTEIIFLHFYKVIFYFNVLEYLLQGHK